MRCGQPPPVSSLLPGWMLPSNPDPKQALPRETAFVWHFVTMKKVSYIEPNSVIQCHLLWQPSELPLCRQYVSHCSWLTPHTLATVFPTMYGSSGWVLSARYLRPHNCSASTTEGKVQGAEERKQLDSQVHPVQACPPREGPDWAHRRASKGALGLKTGTMLGQERRAVYV